MSYTIQPGDTLWGIVKNKYQLTSNRDIANKINEVAKANHISNPDLILAGSNLDLPDTTNSTSVFKPESKTQQKETVIQENMGKKFDTWAIDSNTTSQKAWDEATEKAVDFTTKHYTKEEEKLRNEYTEKMQKEAIDKVSKIPDFAFIGEDYAKDIKENGDKNADNIYKKGLMTLAEDSIKNTKDLDGDTKTINVDEYTQKEIEDYKNFLQTATGSKLDLDEASVEELRATAKYSFDIIDQNKNGKIDAKEEATLYAAMDEDENGIRDGKISYNGYRGVSGALGDSQYKEAIETKLASLYKFLFN